MLQNKIKVRETFRKNNGIPQDGEKLARRSAPSDGHFLYLPPTKLAQLP